MSWLLQAKFFVLLNQRDCVGYLLWTEHETHLGFQTLSVPCPLVSTMINSDGVWILISREKIIAQIKELINIWLIEARVGDKVATQNQ